MSGGKPGTLCGSKLGDEWIDSGTLIRSRSGPPGPLGTAMQLATQLLMGALPEDAGDPEQKRTHQIMFEYDINEIANAELPDIKEKSEIVTVLRSLNKEFQILYGGNLEGSRGDWDGSTIRIDANYEGKAYPTMIELVHEGTHALTSKNNSGKTGAKHMTTAAEELRSQINQLSMYKFLKRTKEYEDKDMERRLQDLASGKLKNDIDAEHKKK